MAIDTIWVFAQSTDGTPTTGTLELLTKARQLGAGTLAAFPERSRPSDGLTIAFGTS